MSWGTPVSGTQKSGYTFTSVPAPSELIKDEPFTFGLFTHDNFPITGTSLVWAQLALVFDMNVNGVLHKLTANYLFKHTETANVGRNNCCNDLVEFAPIANSFDTITIGSIKYAFKLDGFVTNAGNPVSFFSTEESKSNSARLVGRFTSVGPADPTPEEPSPVPLPLPVALLGFGIAGLAGVGRVRRKR